MAKNKPKPAVKKPEPAPKKVSEPVKAAPPPAPVATAKKGSATMEKPSKKNALRESILARKASTKPIAFSLDEVRAIAKTNSAKAAETAEKAAAAKTAGAAKTPAKQTIAIEKPAKPNHVKAASLADILGFNPKKPRATEAEKEEEIPEKFRRYYRLLVDLRSHLLGQLDTHTEETLKRSAKDDAGDLSAYGQHMADAGTDTFDRDFALSMVASEQEALSEIDAAIKRIHDGTYGICEVTQKPIAKERLLAVPFTRYSAEAQKEIERHRHRVRTQAGLFGELGEEGAKMGDDDGGGGGDD